MIGGIFRNILNYTHLNTIKHKLMTTLLLPQYDYINPKSDFNTFYPFFFIPEILFIYIILLSIFFFLLLESKFKFTELLSELYAGFSILFLLHILYFLFFNLNLKNGFFFNYQYTIDYFSSFLKIIIILSTIICILFSINYLYFEKIIYYEYYIFILFAAFSNMMLVSVIDLFSIYLIIELQSLCFYILAAFKTYSNFSTEAGIKYFIQGAVASGLLLLGFSIIYGATGAVQLMDIKLLFTELNYNTNTYNINIFYLGLGFVLISLLFKLAIAPFHIWAPDVYEGAPTVVTFVFSTIPKIGIFGLFIRLLINFCEYIYFLNFILIICGILSIIIGTLGALYQIKLKRWIVFASMPHVGFLIIILAMNKVMSISIMLFYLIIYILITINIFIIILCLRRHNNNLKIISINELLFILKSNKIIAIIFIPLLLSIVGIPPFFGFFNKFTILYWTIGAELKIILSLILIICSVISGLYYIRLIKKTIFIKNFTIKGYLQKINNNNSLILSMLFFFNIYFFIYMNEILLLTTNVTLSLYN